MEPTGQSIGKEEQRTEEPILAADDMLRCTE